MKNSTKKDSHLCPCDSGKPFKDCCQPFLQQVADATTAEELMRSRYCAFVLHNKNYLRYSWHPDTCPKNLNLDEETQWLGLRIKHTEQGQKNDATGRVEFVARYKINGKGFRLHENSRFTHYNHRWVYLNGEVAD